jgi:hypothetical protein
MMEVIGYDDNTHKQTALPFVELVPKKVTFLYQIMKELTSPCKLCFQLKEIQKKV